MTLHNEAKDGEIADIVIMPGDPLRAKYIAENFIENAKLVNTIRCAYCYTGTYRGKRLSIMASGMGMPSMGIYCYELYKFYNVKNIIRIGTCGSFKEDIKILDTLLVKGSYTESNYANAMTGNECHFIESSELLNNNIKAAAQEDGIEIKEVNILCNEYFDLYRENFEDWVNSLPKEYDIAGSEMETFALFYTAKYFGKDATALITCVDSHSDSRVISAEDRQTSLNNMIQLALDAAIK